MAKKPAASYPAKVLQALAQLRKNSVEAFDDPFEGVRISTGFPSLDGVLGGGLLDGRQVLIWGADSSGKSTLALQILGGHLRPGTFGLYLDMERTLVTQHARAMLGHGIVVMPLKDAEEWLQKHGAKHPPVMFVTQPATCEEVTDLMHGMHDAFGALFRWAIFDSIPAAVPEFVLEMDGGQKTIGKQALALTEFLNRMQAVLPKSATTLVLLTQERANIITSGFAGMAPKFRPAGPEAMRFTVSQRIRISRAESHPWKTHFGASSHAAFLTVEKNKTSDQRRGRARLSLEPGHGFSAAADVVDLAVQYAVLREDGPGVLLMPDGVTRTSRAALLTAVRAEGGDKLLGRLTELVFAAAPNRLPVMDLATTKDD